MRGRVAFAVVVVPAAVLAVWSCNPIFGIVDRTAGPTWCEQPAQAGSAYCDDFDRVTAATMAAEEPQTRSALDGGGLSITSAIPASSPPNSLELRSVATTGDAQTLVANLVNFGESYSASMGAFRCSVDVRPAELETLGAGGTSVSVLALGGEVQGGEAPVFIFLSVGVGGNINAQLGSVGNGNAVTMLGQECPMVLNAGGIDKPWVTLQVSFSPIAADGGARDAASGAPCSLGSADAGRPKYVAVIQYGAFENAVLVPQSFMGQPLLGYGIVLAGPGPAVTLHVDNATCSVLDGGVPSL